MLCTALLISSEKPYSAPLGRLPASRTALECVGWCTERADTHKHTAYYFRLKPQTRSLSDLYLHRTHTSSVIRVGSSISSFSLAAKTCPDMRTRDPGNVSGNTTCRHRKGETQIISRCHYKRKPLKMSHFIRLQSFYSFSFCVISFRLFSAIK